jgi:hypothetical protein
MEVWVTQAKISVSGTITHQPASQQSTIYQPWSDGVIFNEEKKHPSFFV